MDSSSPNMSCKTEYIYLLDDKWIIFYSDKWRIHSLSFSPYIFNTPLIFDNDVIANTFRWRTLYSNHTLMEFVMDLNNDTANVNLHFSDKTFLPLETSLRVTIYEQHLININDTIIEPLPTNSWIGTYKDIYHSVPVKYKFIHEGNIVGSIHPFLRPRLLPADCEDGLIMIEPKYCYSLIRVNEKKNNLKMGVCDSASQTFDIGKRKVKSIK